MLIAGGACHTAIVWPCLPFCLFRLLSGANREYRARRLIFLLFGCHRVCQNSLILAPNALCSWYERVAARTMEIGARYSDSAKSLEVGKCLFSSNAAALFAHSPRPTKNHSVMKDLRTRARGAQFSREFDFLLAADGVVRHEYRINARSQSAAHTAPFSTSTYSKSHLEC